MFRFRTHLNYTKLLAAITVSNLGDGIAIVAFPLLAAALTRDPLLVAGLTVVARVPWLLFALPAGAMVDRLDRRLALTFAALMRAGGVGSLGAVALFGHKNLLLLYAVSFLIGVGEVVFDTAGHALLPALVPRDDLEQANGRLMSVIVITNEFVGPPLGGALFAIAVGLPFLVNGGAYIGAVLLVSLMHGRFRIDTKDASTSSFRGEIGEGARWLWGHSLIRTLALISGGINILQNAIIAIAVLYATEILGLSDTGYGLLLSCAAVGSVLGGVVAPHVSRRHGTGTVLSVALLWLSLGYLVLGVTAQPVVAGAMLVANAFAFVVWGVLTDSLRQVLVPHRLLGRVGSVYRLVGWGGGPLGAAAGGILANLFGLRSPFVASTALLLVMALASLPIVNNRIITAARVNALESISHHR